MTTRLRDLITKEVSLVTRPANKKRFLILKGESGTMDGEEILKAVLETDLENEGAVDEILKGLPDETQVAMKGALRLVSAFKDDVPTETVAKLFGVEKKAPPVPAVVPPTEGEEEEEEEEEEKPKKEKKAAEKKEEPCAKKEEPCTKSAIRKSDGSLDLEAVPEALRPEIAAIFKSAEDANRRAAEVEQVLKAEKEKESLRVFIAKAAEYDQLILKSDEFGQLLKSVADAVPPDVMMKLEQVLKAANEGLRECGLMKQKGSDRPGEPSGTDVMTRIEAEAAALVQKGDGLTKEQAVAKVLSQNPKLYEEYLKEQKRNR